MSDNVFQFNWRGMTRNPSYPYAQPQDGSAQARAAYIAKQAADMQGYRPLPNMGGYQPMISGRNVSPESNPLTEPEMDNIQAESKYKLEERIAANEQRIDELKQEYLVLQNEQETDTEELERNVAANRAGIGDTSQYNAWRARVDAREASKQAREADSDATLRQAKSRLNNALLARAYARGDREIAAAQQVYEDELAAYNELARKLGSPEISESELPDEKTYTRGDVEKIILEHRDKKTLEWDSEENLNMAVAAAKTLPEADMIAVLKDIFGNTTKAEGDAKRKKWAEEKEKARKLVQKYQNMTEAQRMVFSSRWNKNDPNDSEIKLLRKFATFDGNAPSMK